MFILQLCSGYSENKNRKQKRNPFISVSTYCKCDHFLFHSSYASPPSAHFSHKTCKIMRYDRQLPPFPIFLWGFLNEINNYNVVKLFSLAFQRNFIGLLVNLSPIPTHSFLLLCVASLCPQLLSLCGSCCMENR